METLNLASWWGATTFGKLEPNEQEYLEDLILKSKDGITFGDIKATDKGGGRIFGNLRLASWRARIFRDLKHNVKRGRMFGDLKPSEKGSSIFGKLKPYEKEGKNI